MNKRLIALFISLVVVIVLIVAMSIAFTVGDVEIETTNVELTSEQQQSIVFDSKIVKHSSIFSLDEEIAISNIELCNPSLKVLSIERKFPNKVCIYITKRVPILSLALEDGTSALIDNELKVIKIVDTITQDYVTPIKGISLPSLQEGSFVSALEWLNPIIDTAISQEFRERRFSAFINEIEYRDYEEGTPDLILLKTNTGVIFVINANFTKEAFSRYYDSYILLTDEQKQNGYLVNEGDTLKWVSSFV